MKKFLIGLLVLGAVFGFCYTAHAAFDINNPLDSIQVEGKGGADIGSILTSVYNLVIFIAQIAFIFLLLAGGVMYLTAGGSDEQVGNAKKLMMNAVIGIVLVFIAWAAGNWVISLLKGFTSK